MLFDKRKRPRSLFYNAFISCFRPCKKRLSAKDEIIFSPDEIEAVRLMDLLGKYQEDAAAEMEISRPTLSRILRRARQKIAMAILHGKTLQLTRSQNGYFLACPSDDKETISEHTGIARYIIYCRFLDGDITEKRVEENPVFTQLLQHGFKEKDILPMRLQNKPFGIHATRFLPEKLEGVQIFIVRKIGENLKNALELRAVNIIHTKLQSIEEVMEKEGFNSVEEKEGSP